ncbi:ribonuclease H-like domain-containing protein [Tanacetum coccineum]
MHYRLPHPGQGVLGPSSAIYASQPTTLPSAFSIMPLQDPTWHMDTGASSYLNFNASNLSTIFDKRLFLSVHVGDGKSIPITNTGHNIIPSHHRPLHLHNVLDYLTRYILLRCDSSSDLYPVTKSSTFPIAFLSKSVSTLHQRLGHPGIVKPIDRLSLHTYSIYHIPKNPSHALKDLNRRNAMYDEYNMLVKNSTWLLVPRPACVNMVRSMWLFKHKFHADGTLSRYKVRLVANGSRQQLGVDFDETFSPVVKSATVRTVLSLVVSRKWPIHQLDVKNGYLNSDLSETVYIHQPPGFVDNRYPHHVYLLQRSLYGLKQVPRFSGSLNNKFDMTDLGAPNYFLGISVDRTPTSLFLSQKKYALQLLERAKMVTCNPSRTTVDTEFKLGPEVQQICLYMHDPREPHFAALKRIFRYVRGTVDFGLHLYVSATTSLVGYTDADWAGCPSTRRSTLGYCVFLGDNLLS